MVGKSHGRHVYSHTPWIHTDLSLQGEKRWGRRPRKLETEESSHTKTEGFLEAMVQIDVT